MSNVQGTFCRNTHPGNDNSEGDILVECPLFSGHFESKILNEDYTQIEYLQSCCKSVIYWHNEWLVFLVFPNFN